MANKDTRKFWSESGEKYDRYALSVTRRPMKKLPYLLTISQILNK